MLKYPFDELPTAGSTTEIVPGLRWLRMPLPMALDHINLYLIEDSDGWWVIDTGMAVGQTEELWEQIFATELQGKPIKAVLATHMHPDHIGMAGWLCERWQVPFYMTRTEYLNGLVYSRMDTEHFSWTSEQYMRRSGYTPEQIEAARKRFSGFGSIMTPMPGAVQRLEDGDSLMINGNSWRIVVGSGHSPEHACLYCESLDILISGDQVIPRITSNVSVSASEPEANPLKDWLASHEHFIDVLPDSVLILPAHNTPFYGLHERMRYLIDHHEAHLLALEEACSRTASTAMELLPVLFKRKLDQDMIGLALGECVAHLNFLHQRGQLSRSEDELGHYRYQSTDDTLVQRLAAPGLERRDETPVRV